MIISYGPLLSFRSSFFPYPPLPIPSSSVDSASGEEWSSWSVCSATCGEGWQSRTRFCVSSSYSTQCSGPLREQRPCNNSAVCPGKLPPPHPKIPPAASLCSPSPLQDPASPLRDPHDSAPQLQQVCGLWDNVHPHLTSMTGFAVLEILGYSHTLIQAEQTYWETPQLWKYSDHIELAQIIPDNCPQFTVAVKVLCFLGVCLSINHTLAALIAVHGAWDEWSPWSLCSSTCGRGYRSRTRTCTPPQFGGDPCEGPEKQTKFCNIAVCPGKDLRFDLISEDFHGNVNNDLGHLLDYLTSCQTPTHLHLCTGGA